MSTSPDDLPESRGRAPRARATRMTTRARPRPEVADGPIVDPPARERPPIERPIAEKPVAEKSTRRRPGRERPGREQPVTGEVRSQPATRRSRLGGIAAKTGVADPDGNGAGKLPRATRRDRAEPKVAANPSRAPQLERKFRQTVTKVDLWSVTKLSLCFYISAMFVTVIALVSLWSIADAAGIVTSVEKFIGDLLNSKDFHFLSAEVLRGAVLIGLVVVALQVVITVVAASFYNIFAELFGGIEITVKEEEAPPAY